MTNKNRIKGKCLSRNNFPKNICLSNFPSSLSIFFLYSILFYSILFYSILFYSILFYSILFMLFYSIFSLFYSILALNNVNYFFCSVKFLQKYLFFLCTIPFGHLPVFLCRFPRCSVRI